MIMYYDDRIRPTILKRWAEDGVPSLESRVEVNIPESQIERHESFTLKDYKIPVSYKVAIAQTMYEAESDAIKAEVRSQREAWHESGRSVRASGEEERLSLVRDYHKYAFTLLRCSRSDTFFSRNFPALSRNIGNILRNAEYKCAAKGIVWLACPAPSKGGKPVAFLWVFCSLFSAHSNNLSSQCAGTTPQGEDFETFIGNEKAKEFKALFSSWVHKIYRVSWFLVLCLVYL
jgi:hypothetical protein